MTPMTRGKLYLCTKTIAVFAIFLIAYVLVSNACGPFFSEAVFVQTTGPDGTYSRYLAGHIGIPQPGYRMRHLVAAYDWLNGTGLSPGEQEQALALDAVLNPTQEKVGGDAQTTAPGIIGWLTARHGIGLPNESKNMYPRPGRPSTGPAAFDSDTTFQLTDRKLPGEDYETFPNCLDDAFAVAARTLAARKAAHPDDLPALTDWVRGQDAVFANCPGTHDSVPTDVSANAPLWLRQDRAYQKAAASFYQTNYSAAIEQLRTIAADRASPWDSTARFVAARATIRLATVGQAKDVPVSAQAAPPNTPYSQGRADALQAYENSVAQQRIAHLTEARTQLQAIFADPAMAPFHQSASGLLDLVNLQIDPMAQVDVLTKRLTAANRPQAPGVFRQALIDLSRFPGGSEPEADSRRPASAVTHSELLDWIRTMAAANPYNSEYSISQQYSYAGQVVARRARAAQQAVAGWRAHGTTPWLIAALTSVGPEDAAVPELLRAAAMLPTGSPAALDVTYQRLRLAGPTLAGRTELLATLPTIAQQGESRSTVNLFTTLLRRTSPALDSFVATAGTLPAGETFDTGETEPLSTAPAPDGLCHTTTPAAATPLFDHDVATILNTRLPLRLLVQAATNPSLPANLRFQIAQAAWTRAVLLNRPDVARGMTSALTGCYASWQPVLAQYDSSATAQDREANGLLALMRFASTEPIVRDGEQRPEGFATYSEFRNNWWQGSDPGGPPRGADNAADVGPRLPGFFGTVPAPLAELPDPAFLTADDRTAAAQEVKTLRAVPCASDYFAGAALAWQQAHPADPRTADILGNAERVIRSGCSTSATKELNHQLFVVVQTKYAGSVWARKYKTWE